MLVSEPVRSILRHLPITLAALLATAPLKAEQPAAKERSTLDLKAREKTLLNGYRRYHGTCSHCHGPGGSGSTIAPSLIEDLAPSEQFQVIVREGSKTGTSVMPGFADNPNVAPYIDDIYAYLTARATGAIGRGRPALTQ